MKSPEFAISLGGSVMAPDCKPDTDYLIQFAKLLHSVGDEKHTIITAGGGWFTRAYQKALREAGIMKAKDLDAIGIAITHINARTLALILSIHGVQSQYLKRLGAPRDPSALVWTTGGNRVGQNTDATLVDWVRILGFRKPLINVTNIPFVYELDADHQPNLNKPIQYMTWSQYGLMVGKHEAGEHLPWGSTATRKASRLGLSVITVGPNLDNLKAVLEGKSPVIGTTIHP